MDTKLGEHADVGQMDNARTLATKRCDELIKWYEGRQKVQRRRMVQSRLVAIGLSGLVPVLVIIQISLPRETLWWLLLSILIAAFPAGATIMSALNEVFQYKDNWIRFSETAEELKSERAKFLTRTTKDYDQKLDEHTALSNFVSKVEGIVMRETRKWRVEAERSKDLDELLQSSSSAVKVQ